MGLRELSGFCHHPHAAQSSRRKHHLRPEKAHELAPLDAEGLRHRDYQRIALLRAHHREANSSIAARGFDNCLARFQLPGALRGPDDAQGETVLHRTKGIECFDLYVEMHVRWREFIYLDDRSVSNGFKNTLKFVCHSH